MSTRNSKHPARPRRDSWNSLLRSKHLLAVSAAAIAAMSGASVAAFAAGSTSALRPARSRIATVEVAKDSVLWPFRSVHGRQSYRVANLAHVTAVRLIGYPYRRLPAQMLRHNARRGVVTLAHSERFLRLRFRATGRVRHASGRPRLRVTRFVMETVTASLSDSYAAAVAGTPGLVSYWRLADSYGTSAADCGWLASGELRRQVRVRVCPRRAEHRPERG